MNQIINKFIYTARSGKSKQNTWWCYLTSFLAISIVDMVYFEDNTR